MIIGNKVDMEKKRQVSQDEGENLAQENHGAYYETSALTGYGIKEAIKNLIDEIKNVVSIILTSKYTFLMLLHHLMSYVVFYKSLICALNSKT